MKIIEQAVLVFSAGGTERVHEVDLIEVGPNRYVVNFRYGKRGNILKDGSKTVLPVGLIEARQLYQKELQDKLDKGYVHASGALPGGGAQQTPKPAPEPVQPAPRPELRSVPPPASGEARIQALLLRLSQGDNPPIPTRPAPAMGTARFVRKIRVPKARPLERVIYRLGELRVAVALPQLIALLGSKTALRDYVIAGALGRIGGGEAIAALMRLLGDGRTVPMVRRMAIEALRLASDDASRQAMAESRLSKLPGTLASPIRQQDGAAFSRIFSAWVADAGEGRAGEVCGVLEELYRIDTPLVRPAFLAAVGALPLKPSYFRTIRALFKAAEYRRDAELFGILAWRFETNRAWFRTVPPRHRRNTQAPQSKIAVLADGKRISFQPGDLGLSETGLAYSSATRQYLRRRSWRVLKRLARDELAGLVSEGSYVRMAVGILLPFTDGSAHPVRNRSRYNYQTRRTETEYFDAFSPYLAFNTILYQNSTRYERFRRSMLWRCRVPYRPGQSAPAMREEAWPMLWDRLPHGLLHLLSASECRPVHEFGVRALKASPLLGTLDLSVATMLLGRPYEGTAQLGLEIARRLYDPAKPDPKLLVAMLGSFSTSARTQGWSWVQQVPWALFQDAAALASLLGHKVAQVRLQARSFVVGQLSLPQITPAFVEALQIRLVAALLLLPLGQEAAARDLCEVLSALWRAFQKALPPAMLVDMLKHPLQQVEELASELVLELPAPPECTLEAMLVSPYGPVRSKGLRLFARIPDASLAQKPRLILALCTSPWGDIRASSAPLVRRMVHLNPALGNELVHALVGVLMTGQPEGVYPHISVLFAGELKAYLGTITASQLEKLLQSKRPAVQEAGGVVLQSWSGLQGLELGTVVRLSNHEVLAVRQATWALFERDLEYIKPRLEEIVGILDSKWEDTRAWAFRFFLEKLDPATFSVELLIGMADSNRGDVQAFAQQVLLRAFSEDRAELYLSRLSEHPSTRIQSFAANYLEQAASNNLEMLQKLVPYFKTILCRVNTGRVAKARVHAFLAQEASRSEAAATLVAEILADQAVSISVEQQARTLSTLTRIQLAFPEKSTIKLIEPPLRTPRIP